VDDEFTVEQKLLLLEKYWDINQVNLAIEDSPENKDEIIDDLFIDSVVYDNMIYVGSNFMIFGKPLATRLDEGGDGSKSITELITLQKEIDETKKLLNITSETKLYYGSAEC
jgi:hypothetical protein